MSLLQYNDGVRKHVAYRNVFNLALLSASPKHHDILITTQECHALSKQRGPTARVWKKCGIQLASHSSKAAKRPIYKVKRSVKAEGTDAQNQ